MKEINTPDAINAIAEALVKELQGVGMGDYVLLGLRRREDGTADLWSRGNANTIAIANMFAYALARINDDAKLAQAIDLIATHPLISARAMAHREGLNKEEVSEQMPAKTEWVN